MEILLFLTALKHLHTSLNHYLQKHTACLLIDVFPVEAEVTVTLQPALNLTKSLYTVAMGEVEPSIRK